MGVCGSTPAPEDTSAPPVYRERKVGSFKKEGHVFKTWNQRFFVLEDGILEYFESCDENKNAIGPSKGSLTLSNFTIDAAVTKVSPSCLPV